MRDTSVMTPSTPLLGPERCTISISVVPQSLPVGGAMSPTVTSSTRHALIDTDIATLTVVQDDAGLAGIYFPGHWTKPKPAVYGPRTSPREFAEITEQLHEYFS